MKKTIYVFLLIACVACGGGKKPNIDNIKVDLKIERFDKDIFARTDTAEMISKYGNFYHNFCELIIGIGSCGNPDFEKNMSAFLADSIVNVAEDKGSAMYSAYADELKQQLTLAFRYFKYYFPERAIPQINIFTSGFNQTLVLDEGCVGIGIEMFLGAAEPMYSKLGISKYLSANMRKERIASEVARTWAIGEFPLPMQQMSLLDVMIYEGKLLYLTSMVCPNLSDTTLLGFTDAQLKFCRNNEAQMWTVLVENKYLYEKNASLIAKFTESAPFTTEFTRESPGKAANWLGLRIVQQFSENTNANLLEIMNEQNSEKILNKSKYNPKR